MTSPGGVPGGVDDAEAGDLVALARGPRRPGAAARSRRRAGSGGSGARARLAHRLATLHHGDVGLVAGERDRARLADRLGAALVIGMGVGQRQQRERPLLDLAQDPAPAELRRGVDQHVLGEVDVDRVVEPAQLQRPGASSFTARACRRRTGRAPRRAGGRRRSRGPQRRDDLVLLEDPHAARPLDDRLQRRQRDLAADRGQDRDPPARAPAPASSRRSRRTGRRTGAGPRSSRRRRSCRRRRAGRRRRRGRRPTLSRPAFSVSRTARLSIVSEASRPTTRPCGPTAFANSRVKLPGPQATSSTGGRRRGRAAGARSAPPRPCRGRSGP